MNGEAFPTRTRISVERWHRMIEARVFRERERVELLDGELWDMAPIDPPHNGLMNRLNHLCVAAAGRDAVVQPAGSLRLGSWSMPQPDLLVLRPRPDFYAGKMPEPADVLLLIEVANGSLDHDRRRKLALYARHGVAEYWIGDAVGRRLEVYRRPQPDGTYAERLVLDPATDVEATVAALALPALRVGLRDLYG